DSPVRDEVVINDRWGSDTRHKHGGYWTTEYTAGMSGIDHPWEENRGMGVSYGYNRAEDLSVYHTGRELVFILVDTVSRGAILPHWLGHSLVIKDLNAAKSVALLGSPTLVKFKAMKSGLAIELPDLPEDLRAQPAWALKIALN